MKTKNITVYDVAVKKKTSQKLVMVTAYDFLSAKLVDNTETDMILVGDSLGMVVLGYESTLPVTLEEMIHHTKAVRRATKNKLVIADMPYMTYHTSIDEAVFNAGRLIKEAGAHAVKLEGGKNRTAVISAITDAEIPVMGHLGLTPQSVNRFGGYKVQGKEKGDAEKLVEDALLIEKSGAFSIVLEGIPREIAKTVTEKLKIPTIGIGAGPDCDGQVLVFHDLLGYTEELPKFVRPYANLKTVITEAINCFGSDVRKGIFPSDSESYHIKPANKD